MLGHAAIRRRGRRVTRALRQRRTRERNVMRLGLCGAQRSDVRQFGRTRVMQQHAFLEGFRMSPSNPLRPPPPARGRCGFTGASGQCKNPGRWDIDGTLSCTTHKLARERVRSDTANSIARSSPRLPGAALTAVANELTAGTHSSAPLSRGPTRPEVRKYRKSSEFWWQKPLVDCGGQPQPAEIVVLREELEPGEAGVWMNSRGVTTGVAELLRDQSGNYATRRVPLPAFVSGLLRSLYDGSGLTCGAPDLIIWNVGTRAVRFAEIKCPHWDAPSTEQLDFHRYIERRGLEVTIVEWEFDS